jgi:hypothetical protein
MVKLSYIIVVITVTLITVTLITVTLSLLSSKEHYTSRAPLPELPPLSESELQSYQKKHKYGFNGNPFFEKQVMPAYANPTKEISAYNGYKIPTKNNEYIPENVDQITLNEIKSTTKSKGLLDTFFDQFINKQIGTMSVINNELFNIKGNYGNGNNLSNFKIISGQNNLPGVIDLTNVTDLSSNSNLSILKQKNMFNTIQGNSNTIQGENDNASLPDTGYVNFLINTFVKYISTSSKYNFIFDNNQDFVNLEIITNVDESKEFTIPFFLYESTLNYTRGITVKFHLIPGGKLIYGLPIYYIHILNIVQSEINGARKLKLEPVKINTFEQPIMDTNGYYQIFNSLGLMYPFETSSNTITSNYYNLKGTSEGEKIPTILFQEQISKFN